MINVKEEGTPTGSTLAQVIDLYTQDTQVLSRHNIRNKNAGTHGCRDLLMIVSREPVVPPEGVPGPVPYVINTVYFCEINGHIYVTVLRNFEGDPKQGIYQRIALRVAESLRVDK
jgi:hypothetical protein